MQLISRTGFSSQCFAETTAPLNEEDGETELPLFQLVLIIFLQEFGRINFS